MANVLTNPGFEDATGWTFTDFSRVSDRAHTGTFAARGQIVAFGGSSEITLPQTVSGVVAGEEHTVSAYTQYGFAGSDGTATVSFDYDDGGWQTVGTIGESDLGDITGNTWKLGSFGSFVAPSTSFDVRFRKSYTVAGFSISTLYIDTTMVDDMVIMLSERAVDAVVALLQADLGAELTAIDAARADGITLAQPANADYHKYDKQVILGEPVQVSVYEDGGGYDLTQEWVDANAGRTDSNVPLVVKVTFFNRDGDTAETMKTRARRYAAAVNNVVIDTPTVDAADDSVQLGSPTRVDEQLEEGTDDTKKMQVLVRLTVDQSETR